MLNNESNFEYNIQTMKQKVLVVYLISKIQFLFIQCEEKLELIDEKITVNTRIYLQKMKELNSNNNTVYLFF